MLFGLLHLFPGSMLGPFSSLISSDPPPIPADAIRLRILANNNSPRDQRIKLIVRDHILTFLSPRLPKDSSHGETSVILRRNAPIVNQLANEALAQQGGILQSDNCIWAHTLSRKVLWKSDLSGGYI